MGPRHQIKHRVAENRQTNRRREKCHTAQIVVPIGDRFIDCIVYVILYRKMYDQRLQKTRSSAYKRRNQPPKN